MKHWLLRSCMLLASATPVCASDFYAGKTVSLIVGSGAGGGFDTYARFFSRYFGKHIPGNPTIVVRNMPGAGGLTATGHVYNVAPRDGTVILHTNPINTLEPLLNPANSRFDARRFQWIGSLNKEIKVCAFWSDKVSSVDDLLTQELVLAASGPASGATIDAKALQQVFGFKFRLVAGYNDTTASELASRRGETDGFCGLAVSRLKNTLSAEFKAGKIRIPIQMALERHPDLPDVPGVFDLVKSEETRHFLNMLYAPWTYGQPVAAPPDTPSDRVAILRDAFVSTMQDGTLIQEANRINMEINWVPGADINKIIDDIYKSSPEVIERAREIYGAKSK